MDWAALVDPWRLVLVVGTGLPVLLLRHRLPAWTRAAWGLLVLAIILAWAVDLTWRGTIPVYAAVLLIASAYWLRAEEKAGAR